jgi:F0F1-type ATP synthase delta subunit
VIKEITQAFTQKLKRKVDFKVTTQPSLLAGLKVTVNGVTYDGSLLAQLERLKEEFTHGAASGRS